MTEYEVYRRYWEHRLYEQNGCGPMVVCVLLLILFLAACCPCKNLENTSTLVERDSSDTKVKTEIIYVTDTLLVEIPAQKAERTTADSASHLENDYAMSDARINPDGTLFHSLETKPQQKPVEFQKPVEKKDSIIYRYKYRDKEVIVEKKLTRWEKFKMDYGGFAFGATVALLLLTIYRVVRKVKKFTIM